MRVRRVRSAWPAREMAGTRAHVHRDPSHRAVAPIRSSRSTTSFPCPPAVGPVILVVGPAENLHRGGRMFCAYSDIGDTVSLLVPQNLPTYRDPEAIITPTPHAGKCHPPSRGEAARPKWLHSPCCGCILDLRDRPAEPPGRAQCQTKRIPADVLSCQIYRWRAGRTSRTASTSR